MNFVKFLRTAFLTVHLWWLLLKGVFLLFNEDWQKCTLRDFVHRSNLYSQIAQTNLQLYSKQISCHANWLKHIRFEENLQKVCGIAIFKGSRLEMFYKKVFFKNFTKFTEKRLSQTLFFHKFTRWRCFCVNLTKLLEQLFYRRPLGDCSWFCLRTLILVFRLF